MLSNKQKVAIRRTVLAQVLARSAYLFYSLDSSLMSACMRTSPTIDLVTSVDI
jgi:hypothetical protein